MKKRLSRIKKELQHWPSIMKVAMSPMMHLRRKGVLFAGMFVVLLCMFLLFLHWMRQLDSLESEFDQKRTPSPTSRRKMKPYRPMTTMKEQAEAPKTTTPLVEMIQIRKKLKLPADAIKLPIRCKNCAVLKYEQCRLDLSPCLKSRPLSPRANLTLIYCIHDPLRELHVSKHLVDEGTWESYTAYFLWSLFAHDKDLHMIDIGANIGVFTLLAAKMNRLVVAVEPVKDNYERLCQALVMNLFYNQVSVVTNAVSNVTAKGIWIETNEADFGGSHVLSGAVVAADDSHSMTSTSSIVLDDLLDVISFGKAILKLDIEGHEPFVLVSSGASRLFSAVYIPVVVMEWGKIDENWIKKSSNLDYVERLLDFLYQRDYVPFEMPYGRALDRRDWRFPRRPDWLWTWDTYWLHKNYSLPNKLWNI